MKYLSICSGIEAASVAWHSLGWSPVGFSEIEPFPSAVLAHHYEGVPNFGDMTQFKEWNIEQPNVLVGGTPCQAFSVAGLRKGLDDARGNLTLTFCEMADHFDPEWVVWENVPGVLSSKDNAFGCFLGALCGFGDAVTSDGGWDRAGVVSGPKRTVAWRILDAQYFGVAQRRRRVFVLAVRGSRNWRAPAALFPVGESIFWDSAPSREAREATSRSSAQCFEPRSPDGHARLVGDFAPTLNRMGGGQREPCVITKTFDFQSSGSYGESPVAATLSARDFKSAKDLVAQPITQYGEIAGSLTARHDSSPCADRGANVIAQPIAFNARQDPDSWEGRTGPLDTDGSTQAVAQPIAWSEELTASINVAGTIQYGGQGGRHDGVMQTNMAVRRLTPVECERLQGFPDNYTNIPWRKSPESPDGSRYKALGNSMAVPVMRWIGRRIATVNAIMAPQNDNKKQSSEVAA